LSTDPLAFGLDVLSFPDGLGLAHHRYLRIPGQFKLGRDFDAKNGIAVFLVMVDDGTDRTLNGLALAPHR
jgi:hypothetical protein